MADHTLPVTEVSSSGARGRGQRPCAAVGGDREWGWPFRAQRQQGDGDPDPTTRAAPGQRPEPARELPLPRAAGQAQPRRTWGFSLWTHTPQDFWPAGRELIGGCCSKPPSLWHLVTRQQITDPVDVCVSRMDARGAHCGTRGDARFVRSSQTVSKSRRLGVGRSPGRVLEPLGDVDVPGTFPGPTAACRSL